MTGVISRCWLFVFTGLVLYRVFVPVGFVVETRQSPLRLGHRHSPLRVIQEYSLRRYDGTSLRTRDAGRLSQPVHSLYGIRESVSPPWNSRRTHMRPMKALNWTHGFENAVSALAVWCVLATATTCSLLAGWISVRWSSLWASAGLGDVCLNLLRTVVGACGVIVVVGLLLADGLCILWQVSQVTGNLGYHASYWGIIVGTVLTTAIAWRTRTSTVQA